LSIAQMTPPQNLSAGLLSFVKFGIVPNPDGQG
jgi:hypothetical protein